MPSLLRLAAIVAVVALITIGALALGAGRSSPAPSEAPTAAPAAADPTTLSALGVPVLVDPFTSDRNGYTMRVQPGARVTRATVAWPAGSPAPGWGDPALDEIIVGDIRFVGTQQPIVGQTEAQWLEVYCGRDGTTDCSPLPNSWQPVTIANQHGYVDIDGVPALPGTIAPNGKLFEAVVTQPDRAWVFTMDGDLDRAIFDAYLQSIKLWPEQAVDTPPLTGTFTSPTYGYSVGVLPEWKMAAATRPWTGYDNVPPTMDGVTLTGTDSSLTAASQALGDQTFDEFLAGFHANSLAGVPQGCDGGEPSTWPEIPVGDQVGRLEMLCNAAEALVHVGDRVYVFDWGNETFDSTKHFPLSAWKELLKSVTFSPEAAK